ncbi:MAB_1171c family putative transporter [Kitasatospora sp. NPDC056531]|uniref:MAB_1171c family putative transporter n=1 Tax=Kitasatospora sp. NPDC056531 TaxID=3345856 RepID=UPI0036BC3980
MNAAMYLTAAMFLFAVCWKVYQLWQAPRDRALRSVTACLICLAVCFSTGFPPEERALNAIARGAALLVSNIPLLAAVYFLLAFYLHSAADRARARRRARLEAVPLLVTVLVITAATFATPAGILRHPYTPAELHNPWIAIFFLAAQLYLVHAFATTSWWTARYARMSRGPAKVGLWLTTGSMVGMAMADACRVVMDVIGWSDGAIPTWLDGAANGFFTIAVPVFIAGLSYPGVMLRVAAFKIWRQHRRTYRRLDPLWQLLHEAFPEDALDRAPAAGTWRDALALHAVHRNYYRRVVECRDGLVRVSPYLAQQGVQDSAAPHEVAGHLRPALQARAAGVPAPTQAIAVALPDEDGLDADARQLVTLSDALTTHR